MNNLKSYTEYAVTTPTTDFVIGFDFNYGTDAVNVTVDGVPATEAGYSVIYLNSTTMRLSPAVPGGVVRLQRETDIDVPDNQFTAGAKFIASNMDENFTQIRHAQQEVRDGFEKLSDDTYEIIDTLQDVGQAAQDAADAAEQAAQTANDAAAQVNDKVSYQDLDDAVEVAVAPVKDYVALPFKVGKSYALYERVMLGNGDIVKSTVANNIVNPNVDMTGWVNPAVEQRTKNLDSFSFDDVLTQNEKNNSATTNLASKLSAVATDERILKITLKRKYLIDSSVTFNRNIEIECVGDGEVIFGSSGSLVFAGSATLLGKLPSNETKYTQTLNVPSGVIAGDVLGIYNPADFSFSKHRAEYRDGQFLRVASVSGGVANTYDLLYSEYNTTCDLYKINQIDVTLRNFKFTMMGSTNSSPVVITYAKPKIYSPEYFGSNRYGMSLRGCFGGFIIDSDGKQFNANTDGYQYGVVLANCQDVRVTFGNFSGSRHGVAIGGSSIECSVPNRNLNISGATITSNVANAGADSHGNSQNITYRDCVILGVSVGGRDLSILDSVIYGRLSDGTCVVFYEITGGLFQIKRCKLITSKSSDIEFITTTFASGDRQQDDDTLLDDVFFDIDDISVEAENSGALSRLFRIVVQNNLQLTKKISVSIDNIKSIKMGQLESVLHFQFATASGSSTTIPVGSVKVDNIINLPSSYLVRAIGSWATGYDMKLMQQSGTQTLSTTSSSQKVLLGSTVTFKHRYPIAPKVSLAVSTEDSTWNGDFLNNGVTAAPYNAVSPAATVRTTYIIPSLQGCSNAIPANKAFKVDWTAQV